MLDDLASSRNGVESCEEAAEAGVDELVVGHGNEAGKPPWAGFERETNCELFPGCDIHLTVKCVCFELFRSVVPAHASTFGLNR